MKQSLFRVMVRNGGYYKEKNMKKLMIFLLAIFLMTFQCFATYKPSGDLVTKDGGTG